MILHELRCPKKNKLVKNQNTQQSKHILESKYPNKLKKTQAEILNGEVKDFGFFLKREEDFEWPPASEHENGLIFGALRGDVLTGLLQYAKT
jgi:hypothetical protein